MNMNTPRHIFLIGLSGSGKSTIGKILAGKLRRPFVDIDKTIEKQTHMTINDIFVEKRESAFRKMESRAIMKTARKRKRPKVVALGGGAFEKRSNRKSVESSGISVWLRCSIEELYKRLKNKTDRPLLNNKMKTLTSGPAEPMRRLKHLLKKRQKNYRKADIYVSTSKRTPRAVSSEIIQKMKSKYEAH